MSSEELTQSEVKRLFVYDPNAGIFIRRVRVSNNTKIGDSAGCMETHRYGNQYLKIGINGKCYSAHRLAWLYVYGKFPDREIDHINGDGCDNRLINIRDVSISNNLRNAKLRSKNKSGHCGVFWNKENSMWKVTIGNKYLGYFGSLLNAVAVRKNAEIEFGFHPNHGQKR